MSHLKNHIATLLQEFDDVLHKSTDKLDSDAEYMRLTELRYLLRNVRELTDIQKFQSLSKSDQIAVGDEAQATGEICKTMTQRTGVDFESLSSRLREVEAAVVDIETYIETRIAITKKEGNAFIPRILRLAEKLRLSPVETDLYHLIIVAQVMYLHVLINPADIAEYASSWPRVRITNMCLTLWLKTTTFGVFMGTKDSHECQR